MNAQQTQTSPAGEYYLRGVMETASRFKLDEDSNFQFFFSYGALDRFGEGTWTVKDNTILLNSRPKPLYDFAMISSSKDEQDLISIRFKDSNTMLLPHVYCVMESGDKKFEKVTDQDGLISFPKMPISKLTIIFEFSGERSSIFKIDNPDHNHFEFKFEPWLMEVFFKDFVFNPEKGSHPLLAGKQYHFEKTK